MAFRIDLDDLTIEETEMLAEHFGLKTTGDLQRWAQQMQQSADNIPLKALRFFVFLAKRQDESDYTLEQAGKLSVNAMQEIFADPNAGGGEAAVFSENSSPQSSSSTAAQSRRKRSGV